MLVENNDEVQFIVNIKKQSEQNDYFTKLASFFKSMADENRVKIIFALSINEMCVKEISIALDISSSLVSQQLRMLKAEVTVKRRRDGKKYIIL